nr:arabinosyltransferase domain-containing protein [Rhodococcus rhodnii]
MASGPPVEPPPPRRSRTPLVAIVAALLGVLAALSVPFLPVQQQQSTLTWPQNDVLASVDAPLVSYAPVRLDVAIPAESVAEVAAAGGGVVVSTAPPGAPDAERYGLVAKVVGGDNAPPALEIVMRDQVLATLDVTPGADTSFTIASTPTETVVTAGGETVTRDGDLRPQMVGVYSDLDGVAPDGTSVTAELDSRFSSSPSAIKLVAMVVAVLATVVALVALYRIDARDGRRSRRVLPARWYRFTPLDGVVVGTLLLWHFIGATTSDDGYQFTMARASETSGYMANYFRWFGVPEAPFGTPYYDLLAVMANISTASPWMRLPALLAGVVAWFVISREVAPRLGRAVKSSRVALWTGALVFLAFWLPYNNGLRPEPIVALGVLLTWCSVERAIATRRLLPAAVAILVGALTVTVGPSGIITFGALIAGARPILQIVIERARALPVPRIAGYLAVLGPMLTTGLVVLVAAFADQTLAAVREMQAVHAIGPSMAWFEEYNRYQWLFNISADGSLARRFGVLVMILSLIVVIPIMLRKGGHIPGTAVGPSRRIVGITIAAVALMMFTPTKWTHHFGVFAGLAGSLALLTAVAVGTTALRSKRNRALFAAAVLFVLALSFTSSNSWWYVSSYSIPWWDKPVEIAGLGAGTILLGLTGLMLLVAGFCFLREPYEKPSATPSRLWSVAPLTVGAGAMVAFMVLSLLKGAVSQYPAFSLASSNFGALAGNSCGLASEVLVETDPNASMLRPVSGDVAGGLAAASVGFDPNGVADDLRADEEAASEGMANSVDNEDGQSSNTAGTGGGAGAAGIGGSTVALPFGLDPATTPVMGSFGAPGAAALESQWYGLPADRGEIVSVSAAGRIHSVDSDGIATPGARLDVEYGTTQPDGSVEVLGSEQPIDIGPAPSWRNLRVPTDRIPAEADVIRLVADDSSADSDHWIAVTPPRVPQTQTLNDLLGSDTPAMIDWSVGLQFPCQRPFDHNLGVAEIPEYRILPDRPAAVMTSLWQNHYGGGPLGWLQLSTSSSTIPTYLREDWDRDWGSLERYERRDTEAVPAEIDADTVTRSGMWTPGPTITAW